jgi:hypothetical protein
MPAIITNKFRINSSNQFYNSFSGTTNYYLGIGRSQPFSTSQIRGDGRSVNEGTDAAALTPVDSFSDEYYSYNDLLALKKILSTDITYAIARRDWTTSTVYDYYRHDYGNYITGTTSVQTAYSTATTLFDAKFYVLNSEKNVYKCLDNNNNAPSTVEPTGTSTSIIQTGDNYKWKYMYTLSASQQANFVSTDFMAVVTNSTVSSSAINGAINIVKIKSAGTNGVTGSYTSIPIRGDGTNGRVTVGVSAGGVTSVTITNVGSGYTFAYIKNSDIVAAGCTNLVGSELDCIIEPKGGHGFNAIKELGGYFVLMNISLAGAETANSGDFTVANDFRRIMLIANPTTNGTLSTANSLRATKAINFASSPTPGTFVADETITQSTTGAVGKVVEWDSTNRILYYIQTRFNNEGIDASGNKTAFSGVNVVTGSSSGATATPSTTTATINNANFISGYANSEIDLNSGDIIYIENRAPIARAADQTENIKLVIEF